MAIRRCSRAKNGLDVREVGERRCRRCGVVLYRQPRRGGCLDERFIPNIIPLCLPSYTPVCLLSRGACDPLYFHRSFSLPFRFLSSCLVAHFTSSLNLPAMLPFNVIRGTFAAAARSSARGHRAALLPAATGGRRGFTFGPTRPVILGGWHASLMRPVYPSKGLAIGKHLSGS